MRAIASSELNVSPRRPALAFAAAVVMLTGSLAFGVAVSADQTTQPQLSAQDLATIPDATVLRTTDRQGGLDAAYYPRVAASEGVGGVAVIDCKAAAGGELDGCATVAEFPTGCLFGLAARQLAMEGIIGAPRVVDTQAVGSGLVRVKVRFGDPAGNASKRCR
jgi:hypothetical protein